MPEKNSLQIAYDVQLLRQLPFDEKMPSIYADSSNVYWKNRQKKQSKWLTCIMAAVLAFIVISGVVHITNKTNPNNLTNDRSLEQTTERHWIECEARVNSRQESALISANQNATRFSAKQCTNLVFMDANNHVLPPQRWAVEARRMEKVNIKSIKRRRKYFRMQELSLTSIAPSFKLWTCLPCVENIIELEPSKDGDRVWQQ